MRAKALRASVQESFNIFQATVAMNTLFLGFCFTGIIILLTVSQDMHFPWDLCSLVLVLAMHALATALLFNHMTAHQIIKKFKIFFPESRVRTIGSVSFVAGIGLMYITIGLILWGKDLKFVAIVAGLGALIFPCGFARIRRLHKGGSHILRVP